MLEELLALGHSGAEYDAWLIDIHKGEQFGSGFVGVNPNSKIPALMDRRGSKPRRVFESGSILLYLAEKLAHSCHQIPTSARFHKGVPQGMFRNNQARITSCMKGLARVPPPQ